MAEKFAIKSNFIDRAVSYFSPEKGAKRMLARAKLALSGQYYRGASGDRMRSDWALSGLRNTTPPLNELDALRTRSRDLNRNDPIACGATETIGINVIGTGLRPRSTIRADEIGISQDQAIEFQRKAERLFLDWGKNADSANKLTFDEIQFLAFRKIIEDGEIIALPTWTNDAWRPIKRTVELIESERLESLSYPDFIQGIKFGQRGEPQIYSLKKYDLSKPDYLVPLAYEQIPARDALGRPNILHVFPTNRIGQVRGIPYFAPVISYFKDMSDYLEAEVVAARISACLAVFITKNDAEIWGQLQSDGVDANGKRIQSIEPGMVNYMNAGESINVVDPKRPGSSFGSFLEGILRLIGVAIGMPYELLLKDFSKTNYSSARASLLEGRRNFTQWRSWFSAKFCQPIYELVLEEAFLRGLFNAPRFDEFKTEYCRAQWIGNGWGWVDPTKEVEASKMAIDYNLSTFAEEITLQGRDWEEIMEQRAREESKLKELGLKETPLEGVSGANTKSQ